MHSPIFLDSSNPLSAEIFKFSCQPFLWEINKIAGRTFSIMRVTEKLSRAANVAAFGPACEQIPLGYIRQRIGSTPERLVSNVRIILADLDSG
jgi:hypothetical protein